MNKSHLGLHFFVNPVQRAWAKCNLIRFQSQKEFRDIWNENKS
jgi:hypothetical protein